MADNSEERWIFKDVIVSSSICAPVGRFVVVHAWYGDDGDDEEYLDSEIVPVEAIESRVTNEWRMWARPSEVRMDLPPEPRDGWRLFHRGHEFLPVIWDDDDSQLVAVCEGTYSSNSYWQMVRCDWPKEEDEQRLAECVNLVRRCAKSQYEASRRSGA